MWDLRVKKIQTIFSRKMINIYLVQSNLIDLKILILLAIQHNNIALALVKFSTLRNRLLNQIKLPSYQAKKFKLSFLIKNNYLVQSNLINLKITYIACDTAH